MAEKAVGGDMARFLQDARAEGRSNRDIANRLMALGVEVSYETVRGWRLRLGVA
jgi:transposase-like protein